MSSIKQHIKTLKEHNKTVSIYLPVPVCPSCKAKLLINPSMTFFRCYDCNKIFEIKSIGQTEREYICTEKLIL